MDSGVSSKNRGSPSARLHASLAARSCLDGAGISRGRRAQSPGVPTLGSRHRRRHVKFNGYPQGQRLCHGMAPVSYKSRPDPSFASFAHVLKPSPGSSSLPDDPKLPRRVELSLRIQHRRLCGFVSHAFKVWVSWISGCLALPFPNSTEMPPSIRRAPAERLGVLLFSGVLSRRAGRWRRWPMPRRR